MVTKYLNILFEWNCKKFGGLFLGCKLRFPINMCPATPPNNMKHTYDCVTLTFGFLFFSLHVVLKYNYQKCYVI